MMGRLFAIIAVFALAACESTNSSNWSGGATTPFKQAEQSCGDLIKSVEREADRREFFIGCMGALGWAPKAGASIEI